MDFNKAFFLKVADQKPRWRVIDAEGQIVGRLATRIADALRGKDRPEYTPHSDAGDYVVVINAEKIVFSGKKMKQKIEDNTALVLEDGIFFSARPDNNQKEIGEIKENELVEVLSISSNTYYLKTDSTWKFYWI